MTDTPDKQLTIVTAAPGSFADDSRLRSLLGSIRKTGARICCLFPGSELLTVEGDRHQRSLLQTIEGVISLEFRPGT